MVNNPFPSDTEQPLVVICGPTAGGKTAFAVHLARTLPIEVISADSRQLYRLMDIGTAKATADEQEAVRHHLIDIVDPDEPFSASDFVDRAHRCIEDIRSRGCYPVIVGGTGLYIKALTEGLVETPDPDPDYRNHLHRWEEEEGVAVLYHRLTELDPVLAQRISPIDSKRIARGLEVFHLTGKRLSDLQAEHAFKESPFKLLTFCLTDERQRLYQRINVRVEQMVRDGLVGEVEGLLNRGFSPELKSMKTIGYREIVQHLQDDLTLSEAMDRIQMESRRYAKRQLTWFRKNKTIIWLDNNPQFDTISDTIGRFYAM